MTDDQTPGREGPSRSTGDPDDAGRPDRDEEWRRRLREGENLLSAAEGTLACLRERVESLAAIAAHIRTTGEIPSNVGETPRIEESGA